MSELKDKIIIALDVDTQYKAMNIIEKTHEFAGYYKIGLGFLACSGVEFAKKLVDDGYKIFLDLKLFDISQTITDAVARLSDIGIHIMTLHGDSYVISAAIKGRFLSGRSDMDLYAVTVLTSLSESDLISSGYDTSPKDMVLQRARIAALCGADGVISSGHECREIKSLGLGVKVITPGIRMSSMQNNDQKRVMTPKQAITEGADHIVMGRGITLSQDPAGAVKEVFHNIQEA